MAWWLQVGFLGTLSFIHSFAYLSVYLSIYLKFNYLLGEGDVQVPCALVEARTICRPLFSPPTLSDLEVELGLSDLVASTRPH